MEGLGTGKIRFVFKMHLISVAVTCRGLINIASWSFFFCRHHRHLPLGGLQSPGAAWAGPVWYHLSLPACLCHPEDYRPRPCTSNHLPQARSFKWKYSKQTTTMNCNEHKKWKKRKKVYKKKQKNNNFLSSYTGFLFSFCSSHTSAHV